MPLTARQREHVLGLVMEVCPECASVQIAEVLSIEERPELPNVLPLGPWRRLRLIIECDACCLRRPTERWLYGEILSLREPMHEGELLSRSNPLLGILVDHGINPGVELRPKDIQPGVRRAVIALQLREYERAYLALGRSSLPDLMLPWSVLTVIGWGVLLVVINPRVSVSGPLWPVPLAILALSGAICAVLMGSLVLLRRRVRTRFVLRAYEANCKQLGAEQDEIDGAIRLSRQYGYRLTAWWG